MPVTPFHWSVVILGMLFFNVFYIPGLFLGSTIMDIEPFYYHFVQGVHDGYTHHFFHTYIGVTIIGGFVAAFLLIYRDKIDIKLNEYKIGQGHLSNWKIVLSSLVGAWGHAFLDNITNLGMKPFWPLSNNNPWYGLINVNLMMIITGSILFIILLIYIYKIYKS